MTQVFKRFFNSTDKRVLLENFLSLSALQLFSMVLPLLTLPYLLRVIGFDHYGTIVWASSLIAYFQTLTDYSFRVTATRDVAIHKHNQKQLNLIYSKVITTKTLFLIISTITLIAIINLYTPFYKERTVFYLTIPLLLGYALFPEWFFQGIENMKYITYLNLSIKIFFTLGIFIFIRQKTDYWMYPLFQSCGYIGAGIAGQYILMRKYKIKFHPLPRRIISQTLKQNFPIFVNQFVPNLYNNTSVFFLGILTTNATIGVYNAINTIVNLGVTLIEIFSRVFFPFLNRNKNAFGKYKNITLGLAATIILFFLLGNKVIFWALHIQDPYAFFVLFILSFGLMGYTLYNIYGVNFFIIHRKDKLVMWNTMIASGIGLILAYPLIKGWGIFGAAINLSFCRLLMGGGLLKKYFAYDRVR